jgi:hypothetical protein
MSSWSLNNITAPDNYTAGSTLENLPILDHINIDVTNGGIFWQLKLAANELESFGQWDTEVFMITASRTLDRPGMVGIRVRAAIPAAQLPAGSTQAQVTVEAVA